MHRMNLKANFSVLEGNDHEALGEATIWDGDFRFAINRSWIELLLQGRVIIIICPDLSYL